MRQSSQAVPVGSDTTGNNGLYSSVAPAHLLSVASRRIPGALDGRLRVLDAGKRSLLIPTPISEERL